MQRIVIFIALGVFLYIIPPGGFSAWSFESGVRWFYLFVVSFLVFNLLYPFIMKLAYRINALDFPNERKMHQFPIPRIGGLGIYLSFIFTVIRNFQFPKEIIGILISSTIVFISGFMDDIKGLSASKRFVFQIVAAIVCVIFGVRITLPIDNIFLKDFLSDIVTVLWMVGITNAFNFLDGIDGLAGSVSLIINLIFLFIVVNTNQYQVMFITSSICGSVFGFLVYNFNPAKIFMGDGGSNFLGFIIAVLAVYLGWAHNNPFVSMTAPLIICGILIFDMIYITVSRFRNKLVKSFKEYLEYTGKDHLHHRLINIGFSVNGTVLFIVILNTLLGIVAIRMVVKDLAIESFLSFFEAILIFVMIAILMFNARRKINMGEL
jgi:UDP-GlcNAc:undecaprenyl-phosphate GlcNAc-1-phosphate transferase